jgi:hypothetical protein
MLDELRAQLSLSSIREKARKSQVMDNYHNIGTALSELQAWKFTSKAELAQEQAQLVEEANKQLRELEQEVAQSAATASEESLARNDFGRNYIVGNNAEILNFNGIVVQPSDGTTEFDEGINFSLNRRILDEVAAAKPQEKQEAKSQSRAFFKGKLAEQELSYSNSGLFQQTQPEIAGGEQPASGQVPGLPQGGRAGLQSHTIRNVVPTTPQNQLWGDSYDSESIAFQGGIDVSGGTDLAYEFASPASGGAWTEAGGLSLDMTLPRGGRELTFTKVGGDPQLILAFRPEESVSRGMGAVWGLACLAAAIVFVRWLTRGGVTRDRAAMAAAIVGVLLAWLLPTPVRYAGLVVFLVGAGWLIVRRVAAVHAK